MWILAGLIACGMGAAFIGAYAINHQSLAWGVVAGVLLIVYLSPVVFDDF